MKYLQDLSKDQKEVPGYKSTYYSHPIKADFILDKFCESMLQDISKMLATLDGQKFRGRILGAQEVFYDLRLERSEYQNEKIIVAADVYRVKANDPGFDSHKADEFFSYETFLKKKKKYKGVDLINEGGIIESTEICRDYFFVESIVEILRKMKEITRDDRYLSEIDIENLMKQL